MVFTLFKSTGPTNPELPSLQDWQKGMAVTPKRMHFHARISEIRRGASLFGSQLPVPRLHGNWKPGPTSPLGCILPQLPGLKRRLCLAFIRVVPVLVTE